MKIESIYDCDFDIKNYFDFPSCMIAFAYSLKNSTLFIVGKRIFFRRRNLNLTLITYFCSSNDLKYVVDKLIKNGYKIKVLNWADKDMECFEKMRYDYEYSVEKDYDFDFKWKNGKSRGRLKNKLKNAAELYDVKKLCDYDEFVELFNEWYNAAKERHYIVIKGHYLKYAERHCGGLSENTEMIGFYNKETGELCGVSSWEIYNNMAQVTLMKHKMGDNNLSVYLWWKTIQILVSDRSVDKVFCGSTADKLKQGLGMNKNIAYKIKV